MLKAMEMALKASWIEPDVLEGGKSMSEIRVKENESLESALRRFKRSCAKEGVIAEVKKREHYVSPSLKRKQKSEAARKNKRKFYDFVSLLVLMRSGTWVPPGPAFP